MKKILLFTISALFLGAAALSAHCGKCGVGEDKAHPKAEEMKDKKAAKKDCADCPMSKKGKKCPEMKGDKAKAKKCCPEGEHKDGKKCDCPEGAHKDGKMCPEMNKGGKKCPVTGAEAKAGKKYMCAMKCVESDKPGKCPKCGMPMEEVKVEAKK